MVNGSQEVTTDPKQIQHDAMHRQEPLRVRGGGEPPHLSLTRPGRLVRDFRPIVLVLPRAVQHGGHDRAVRRRIAAELVRDQPARLPALSFQQLTKEARRRPAIAPRLYEDVDDIVPELFLARHWPARVAVSRRLAPCRRTGGR